MKAINLIVLLSICYFENLNSQEVNPCVLYEEIYNNDLQSRFRFTFASDSTIGFKPNTLNDFIKSYKQYLSKKQLRKIYNQALAKNTSKEFRCFKDSLISSKEELFSHIKKIDAGEFIKDSPFVKFVDLKQLEISKIKNEEERYKQLNALTQTIEFTKYTAFMNYYTARIIEYSNPLFYNDFAFIQLHVIKGYRDYSFNIIYLFKKNGKEWKLISNKTFSN